MSSYQKFKIALCQMKVINDKKANLFKAKEMIENACLNYKPELVVLPEYFNCPVGMGYTDQYAEHESNSESLEMLSQVAKKLKINLIGGSLPIKEGDKFFNTSYCFDRHGSIKARHRKLHLFDIDIPGKIKYQESATLSPGNDFTVFHSDVAKIGVGICYDIRFGEYPHLLKKEHNIEMMVYPAAFNTVTGPMHWELLHRSRALDNNVFVAICSPARNTENISMYQCHGYSSVDDPFGKIISSTEFGEVIICAEIDKSLIKDISEQIPTWKQKRTDLYDLINKKI